MPKIAGQTFIEEKNLLWIDLHTCSTVYAQELFDIKVKEAYKYGLASVEFIYGTPDEYDGSIEEAYIWILEHGHELVQEFTYIHAGIIVSIKNNPSPEPKDENMSFSAITPEYDNSFWRKYYYLHPLYPYRHDYGTGEVAGIVGCSMELVRNLIQYGYEGENIPDAKLLTVYNDSWKENITSWYLTERSLRKISEVWNKISAQYAEILMKNGASESEISDILKKIKSIPSGNITKSAKMALTIRLFQLAISDI